MFEHKTEQLLPLPKFARRLTLSIVVAVGVLALGLSVGVLGYHFLAGFAWIDALLETCMILTGMGPVGVLRSNAAKIFAALYALFSGVLFLSIMAIVISPVLHRFLHKFHLDEEDADNG